MNSRLLPSFFFFFTLLSGFQIYEAQLYTNSLEQKTSRNNKVIIYFNPEIVPNVDEIRDVTYDSFFSAVTDRFSRTKNNTVSRVQTPVSYDNVDIETVKQIIENNDADFAVVPKVKFFKVGIGTYVFSSQVVVSMKLYNASGKLISERSYDTLKKNARIFGSAENSIKIGTDGVLKSILKDIRRTHS